MFDISIVNKRYFQIRLGTVQLDVEPPKVKVLKKITSLLNAKEDQAVDGLIEAVTLILSKNTSGYQVPQELIEELDLDQLTVIMTAYSEWLSKVRNSPNS